jgi:hypothetical protein
LSYKLLRKAAPFGTKERSPEIPAFAGKKHMGIRIYVAEDMIKRKTCEVSNLSACRSLDVAGEGPKT